MDFELTRTVETGREFVLAIAALTLLAFTITRFSLVNDIVATAAAIFIGAPLYIKIASNLIENEKGAFRKFKSSHSLVSILVIPFLVFLVINWPLQLGQLPSMSLNYFAGLVIMYLTFRYFLFLYDLLGMKEQDYRTKFFVLVPSTFGMSVATLIIVKTVLGIVVVI